MRALTAFGIERTFAIQALTLPIALGGADLIGQARTGMGKTLGFGVPLLQRLPPTVRVRFRGRDGAGPDAEQQPAAVADEAIGRPAAVTAARRARWSWCPRGSFACR